MRRRLVPALCCLVLLLVAPGPAHTQQALINGSRTLAGGLNAVTTTGTPNVYAATLPLLTAYAPTMCLTATFHAANTGAVTLNVNSLGALPVRQWLGGTLVELEADDISAGQILELCYDSTRWQVVSTPARPQSTLAWGNITGTLGAQTDLQNALNAKQASLGYTPVTTARTLAVQGTTNQVSVTPSTALDLTTNRAWVISIPSNASLNVAKLTNLTTNGVVTTQGNDGTLGVSAQVLTQSGLTWNVAPSTCAADVNGGKLTVVGSQIQCSSDAGGAGGGGSPAFSAVTSGTNSTATMLVGSGAALGPTPTNPGTVTANRLQSTGAGLVKVDALGQPSLALATDVVARFSGGACSGYLKSDGTCDTPAGGGVGVTDGDKGDLTVSSGGTVWTIDASTITYAKLQNISAASRVLGRGSAAGAGVPQEITLGTLLLMSGTTLNVGGTLAALNTAITDANLLPDPGANGLVARTGATTTLNRTLTGTANQITVTNGTGEAGNPTISVPTAAQLSVAKLTNLTSDGPVVTAGGDGTLAVSTAVLTQAGLTWNVSTTGCTGDPNGGALTVNLSNQIVCSADEGGAGGGTAFSAISSGSNTIAAMQVGTGASLAPTGTGTVSANRVIAGGAGIVKVNASNVPTTSAYADIVGLFASGTCSGYLKSDGTCDSAPVANARADGTTKGVATFTSTQFSDNGAGVISLNITSGPKAGAGTTGYLLSTDWVTFNSKVPASLTLALTGTTNEIEIDQPAPLTLATNRAWQIGIPSNAQLSVAKLLNLTTNGFVKTQLSDGSLTVQATLAASDIGLGNVTNDAQLRRSANDWLTGVGIPEKAAPTASDKVLIEDQAVGGTKKWVSIGNLPSAAGSKHIIRDEGGAGLTPRTYLNCVGTGITCADNAGADATNITVEGGTSGGGGGIRSKTFTSSTTWTFLAADHGLGSSVVVATYTTAGQRVFGTETVSVAGNVTVTWSSAQAGTMVVSGGPYDLMQIAMDAYLHGAMGGL